MEDPEVRKALGAILLVARVQEKNWNESEAAEHAGVNAKTIGRMERGENHEWASLEKYAKALGKPLSEWLTHAVALAAFNNSRKETQQVDTGGPQGTATTTVAGNLQRPNNKKGQSSSH